MTVPENVQSPSRPGRVACSLWHRIRHISRVDGVLDFEFEHTSVVFCRLGRESSRRGIEGILDSRSERWAPRQFWGPNDGRI